MRDYDPTTGRYIEADPLGLVDGVSVYGYVRQNPGRYVDPRGEFGVAGAVVGGLSNLGIQILVNYAKYGDLTTALRCVDIKDVILSAGFGFLGASPLSAARTGRYGSAGGIVVVTTWTKKITTPIPVRIGDECECDGGQGLKNGALELLKKIHL
jgi:uncharacterized protein RhaS with RHS repeats